MKNKFTKILAMILLLSITIVPLSSSISYSVEEYSEEDLDSDLEYLKGLIQYVESIYKDDISQKELVEGAYKGIFSSLDDYSHYYSKEEFKALNESVSEEFVGVGIHITEKNGFVTVISPIDGSPAFKAGLKSEDKIVSVDDIDITGFSTEKAAKLIKGEQNTVVRLGILRGNTNKIIYIDITRELIKINPVSSKILENDIGYIKIAQFNANTYENFKNTLNGLDESNIKKIVVDLRNNGGGYLNEVIEILRLLVPEGPVVHIKSSDGELQTYSSYLSEPKYEVAVLVNGGTASASEIFSGAIKDYKLGNIIGTNTFGKGTVQNVIALTNGGGLKITVAEYLTPNKNKVDGIGIAPDIVVEDTIDVDFDLSDIPKLKKQRKPTLGVVGLDVLGAEMILEILGYDIDTPDGILDEITFEGIKNFQSDQNLYRYGVLDFTTQGALEDALDEYIMSNDKDNVLQKAIESFN